MAYNASTGLWTPDNPDGSTTGSGAPGGGLLNPTPKATSSVAANLAADTSQASPLMAVAKQQGMDYANSRGALNSSIGAQAAQAAELAAMTPVATADANNVTQKDLSAQGYAQSTGLQAQSEASQEKIAAENVGANQKIADTQQFTQLQIANMNVTSNEQDKAAAMAQGYANIYGSMVNTINNNPNIPADSRTQYLQDAQTLFNNGMGLVEQTYNVALDWGQGGGSSGGSTGTSSAFAPATGSAASGPVSYTAPSGAQFDAQGHFLGYAANSR